MLRFKWPLIAGLTIGCIFYFFYHNIVHPGKIRAFKAEVIYVMDSSQVTDSGALNGDWKTQLRGRFFEEGLIPEMVDSGKNRVRVIVEEVNDTALFKRILNNGGRIEFRPVYRLNELPGFLEQADRVAARLFPGGQGSIYSYFSPTIPTEKGAISRYPAAIGAVSRKDVASLFRILTDPRMVTSLPADLEFRLGNLSEEVRLRNTPEDLMVFATRKLDTGSIITNRDIANAQSGDHDEAPGNIYLYFNENGRNKWEYITNENVDNNIAILLSDTVVSAPAVNAPLHNSSVVVHTRLTSAAVLKFCQEANRGILPENIRQEKLSVSHQPLSGRASRIVVSLVAAMAAAALASLIFKTLKNR